jgi:hypothetical protein
VERLDAKCSENLGVFGLGVTPFEVIADMLGGRFRQFLRAPWKVPATPKNMLLNGC